MQKNLESVADEHNNFLNMLPSMPKTSKSVFSQHYVSASAKLLSRILFPKTVREVARHGARSPFHCPWDNWAFEVLSERAQHFWACWENCLPCSSFDNCKKDLKKLDGQEMTSCTSAASRMARNLVGVGGQEQRSWISPADGTRPHMRQPEESEPDG